MRICAKAVNYVKKYRLLPVLVILSLSLFFVLPVSSEYENDQNFSHSKEFPKRDNVSYSIKSAKFTDADTIETIIAFKGNYGDTSEFGVLSVVAVYDRNDNRLIALSNKIYIMNPFKTADIKELTQTVILPENNAELYRRDF